MKTHCTRVVGGNLVSNLNTVRDIAKYAPDDDMTTVVNHLIYDSFGRVTSESNPAVDSLFLFTGRPFDSDTGLQNNLNRWYDPAIGRWLSEDPIGFAGGDANLCRYVGNRVLRRFDPSGLQELGIWRRYPSPTGTFEIEVNSVQVKRPDQQLRLGEGSTGYILRYHAPKGVCDNDKCEKIHLVQALAKSWGFLPGYSPHFDAKEDETGYPFPPYAGQEAPPRPGEGDGPSVGMQDAPFEGGAYLSTRRWQVEVCAVCTTTLRKGDYESVIQQVLGCVSFYWYQSLPPADNTAWIVINGDRIEKGQSRLFAAQPVSSFWSSAANAYKPQHQRR